MKSSDVPNLSVLRIQTLVLSEVGVTNLFNQEEHEKETQDGLENHYRCLVREIVEIFLHLRIHHLVKLHNAQFKKHIIRHNFIKTIKFSGQ
jgi:hypothetical protein